MCVYVYRGRVGRNLHPEVYESQSEPVETSGLVGVMQIEWGCVFVCVCKGKYETERECDGSEGECERRWCKRVRVVHTSVVRVRVCVCVCARACVRMVGIMCWVLQRGGPCECVGARARARTRARALVLFVFALYPLCVCVCVCGSVCVCVVYLFGHGNSSRASSQ